MKTILHCSYLHPVDDSRIARYISNFKIAHKVIGVKSRATNYSVYELNPSVNKFMRLLIAIYEIFKFNVQNNFSGNNTINILHDPFLLLFSPLILLARGTIVFDAHEDVPVNLKMRGMSIMVIRTVELVLFVFIKLFCAFSIVCVESQRGRWYFPNNSIFPNFIGLDSINFQGHGENFAQRNKIIYVGNISKERGGYTLLKLADELKDSNLLIYFYGRCDDNAIDALLKSSEKIVYCGWRDRDILENELKTASIGISLLENNEAYYLSYPLKLIDYIRFGVPFLSTPNQFAEKIVERFGVGMIINNDDDMKLKIHELNTNLDLYRSNYVKNELDILREFRFVPDEKLLKFNDV